MRITNNVLNNSFIRNLSKNLKQMQKYQNQLSTGKEVSRPSDNPLLVGKIMSMDNNIMQNEQYNSNISDTLGWVKTQDSALRDATDVLHRIKDLMIYASNGSLSETDRGAIKDEVQMQVEHLADVLNTNFDGRYIFGGQETTTRPFEVGDASGSMLNYNDKPGAKENITREIATGVTIDLIVDGSKITNADKASADNQELGVLLGKVITAIDRGDEDDLKNLSEDYLADIEFHTDNVVKVRTQIGAINNRLDAAKDRNESENLNLKSVLSEKEDIDIAEKFMEYMVMTTVYQASLSIGSKILQPSILDYLR
ncbi:flagellar hook-associated protein FlgL [Tissierellaceae bacterium HCP3S3_D8]